MTEMEHEAGQLVPPVYVIAGYERLSRQLLGGYSAEDYKRLAAERRQREREEPLPVKARRWAHSGVRSVRSRRDTVRGAIALRIASWLELGGDQW